VGARTFSVITSPFGTHSKGQSAWKKDMPAIAAANNGPYVATAKPAFHLDLMTKILPRLIIIRT
jgi:pyruvate ferredoxin oxidoreductase beta subunit